MELLKDNIASRFSESAGDLKASLSAMPEAAIMLGSGFSNATEHFEIIKSVPYSKIKHFPKPTTLGHGDQLLIAKIAGKTVAIFTGRNHLYEGSHLHEVATPIFLAYYLGIRNIIFLNSAGGLNPTYRAGDLMLIADIINFTSRRPHSLFRLEVFASMKISDSVFDPMWLEAASASLIRQKVAHTAGTYIQVTGPSYETRAEIRMFRLMQADAIGMSTVIEAICCRLLGIKTAGCSVITNVLNPYNLSILTHEEVMRTAAANAGKAAQYIEAGVTSMNIT